MEPLYVALVGLPSWLEMALLAGLVLVLFGKKLPMFGRSLGRGVIDLKQGVFNLRDDLKDVGAEGRDDDGSEDPNSSKSA